MDNEFVFEPQVITLEIAEEVARKLRERAVRDHIRDFGGITVVCLRPAESEQERHFFRS